MHDILGDGFELGDVLRPFEGIDGVSVAEFVRGEIGNTCQITNDMGMLLLTVEIVCIV